MNEQTKIQPKSSIAYVNIVKELKNKNTDVRISAAYQVGLRSKVSNEAGENIRVLCGVFEGFV